MVFTLNLTFSFQLKTLITGWEYGLRPWNTMYLSILHRPTTPHFSLVILQITSDGWNWMFRKADSVLMGCDMLERFTAPRGFHQAIRMCRVLRLEREPLI